MIYNIFFRAVAVLSHIGASCGLIAAGMWVERMFPHQIHIVLLSFAVAVGFWLGVMRFLLIPALKQDWSGKSASPEGE